MSKKLIYFKLKPKDKGIENIFYFCTSNLRIMRTFSLVIILFFLLRSAMGQVFTREEIELLKESEGWSEGSINLMDGTELEGLVKYNDREGFLSYQDGENKKVFTANSVGGFRFFDEIQRRHRVFYTLDYEDSKNIKRPLFFEVVREYKDFAILSRAEPIEIYQKPLNLYGTTPVNSPVTQNNTIGRYTRLEVSQVETIFIMDSNGAVRPYIEVKMKEDGVKSLTTKKDRKTKTKVIDSDLLAQYVTQPVYDELKKYAEENDLKFNRRDDFMKLLEYYDQLAEK